MMQIQKVIFFTTVLFFFGYLPIHSQNRNDSLQKEFLLIKDDTTRIKLLFNMGQQFVDGPTDSLIFYYQKSLNLIDSLIQICDSETELIVFKRLRYNAILQIGVENYYQGEYSKALLNYDKALQISNDLKDKVLRSEVYEAIAIVYKNQGEYSKALPYYQQALETALATNDTFWVATCYINMGSLQGSLTNYSKAFNLFQKGLKLFEQMNHKRRIAVTYLSLSYLFIEQLDYTKALNYIDKAMELANQAFDNKTILECLIVTGNILEAEGQFTKARDSYFKAVDLNLELGLSRVLDETYLAIGKTYYEENEFDKAMDYFQLALKIAEGQDDKITIAEVLINLGNLSIENGKFNKAISFLTESLRLSEEAGHPKMIMNSYLYLSRAWEKMGSSRKSFQYYKLFTAYKDTVYSTEKYISVRDLEMKYEIEKSEQQLILLKEKNEVQELKLSKRFWLFVGSLILMALLIIITFILIRNFRLKSKHSAILLEQKLLRSQMNPHFIFNSLIAIQSFIYKNEAVIAGDYLSNFAELIRITLDNSISEFVVLKKELKMLQVYLELQSLRYEDKFDFSISINPKIDTESIKIPPMLAQPFIENSIEHGLRHKKEKGKIEINYTMLDNSILFTVQDNGVGRIKSNELEINRKHQSMATSITKERLIVLSKKFRKSTFHFVLFH